MKIRTMKKVGMKIPGVLRVAVPPGIGDSLWSVAKIPSILKKRPEFKKVMVCVKGTDLNRSDDFLNHFSFIDAAVYEDFPIHYPGKPHISPEGPYIYIESQPNFMDSYDYLLISNGALERGTRLEDWYSKYDTDFDIGDEFEFRPSEIEEAQAIVRAEVGKCPFMVFYLGPKSGNTVEGHNRGPLWSMEDWAHFADLIRKKNSDMKFVLVGAPYDADYTAEFVQKYPRKFWVNKVGQTRIGVTYSLIKMSQFCLSYQSGIGIFSVYLHHPTAIWWRPYGDSIHPVHFLSFQESMASAWAPPWSLGPEGNYLPLIYTKCSPESLAEDVSSRGWCG